MDQSPVSAVPQGTRTAAGAGAPTRVPMGSCRLAVMLDVTARSGTSPSLTLSVEWSHDGINFGPAEPVDSMAAATAAGRKVKDFTVKGEFFRVAWAIAGTTPSFTFSVSAYGV